MTAPLLYIVRHGSTEMNDPGDERLRGWLNVGLTQDGHEESQRAAEHFEGMKLPFIVASDLRRTMETAHHISNTTGAMVYTDPRLRPWHVGQLTGKSAVDNLPLINHHLKHRDEPIPDGESFNQFTSRWGEALSAYANKARRIGSAPALVTSHSNALSLPYILFSTPPESATKGRPHPGEIIQLNDDASMRHYDGIGPKRIVDTGVTARIPV